MTIIEQQIKDLENRYYKLKCRYCNNDYFGNRNEYNQEMSSPNNEWTCQHCGKSDSSAFNDEYFEETQNKLELLNYINFLENRIKELELKK